jgi:hypothetical protein
MRKIYNVCTKTEKEKRHKFDSFSHKQIPTSREKQQGIKNYKCISEDASHKLQ